MKITDDDLEILPLAIGIFILLSVIALVGWTLTSFTS